MPYTVVSHTAIPTPRLSMLLTGEGIKKLASMVEDQDRVRITEWADVTEECDKKRHYGRFEIIKVEK